MLVDVILHLRGS